ncbi:MAG: thymidine phosphorylase [Crocinitomicaceae bacterium]|nr:thymidine phosphorylase [Crocinitomicaceae bacterium]
MLIPEIIRNKRDGHALSTAEIQRFVQGVTDEEVTDAQIAAFTMASIFQDISYRECTDLTLAIRDSGKVLKWDADRLGGPVLDKHSTGGVGDTVSLILAPILAACGGFVPMIAGRGLAHTGGTIDKLESIPGYDTSPDESTFRNAVQECGFAIAGQTEDFTPADRRMYATRDVTATVEQCGLITASILSKKLAAGLDSLIMDIKVGNGAFMKDVTVARELSDSLCSVGTQAGMPTEALLTDMNEPLANSAGNGLEVREAMCLLRGEVKGGRLYDVTKALAIQNGCLSGLFSSEREGDEFVTRVLSNGAAAEHFAQSIAAMGGPIDLLTNAMRISSAPIIRPVMPAEEDWGKALVEVDTRQLGLAVVDLGGGRTHSGQSIDHSVGCTNWMRRGSLADSQVPLAYIHARNQVDFDRAARRIQQAFLFSEKLQTSQDAIVIEHRTA